MRVGVIQRSDEPMSFARYRQEVCVRLPRLGVECIPVRDGQRCAEDVDVLWDPGLRLRHVPGALLGATSPVVATIHGLMDFTLSPRESMGGVRALVPQAYKTARLTRGWRTLAPCVRRVITVSAYGAEEVGRALDVPDAHMRPIHHGVDHAVFMPGDALGATGRGYFLVVSQYQPKKNVDRVLAAWSQIDADRRPALIAVVPGYPSGRSVPDGVDLRLQPHGPEALAGLYRGALALVAPSLHETFGMPLAEAMACGCPIITSNVTACPEITGAAAVHVEPRSVGAIRDAMARVAHDAGLRDRMRQAGLARAARYTWEASASAHATVFEEAACAVEETGVRG